MSKKKFKLEIKLDSNLFHSKEKKDVVYFTKNKIDFKDTIEFFENLIIITGERSSTINLEESLTTIKSNYYKEINKALIYTYFLKGNFIIESIELTVDKNKKSLDKNKLNQPFSKEILHNQKFEDKELSLLFMNVNESESLFISLMFLTKSFNEPNSRFDNCWKSFNCLIRQLSKEEKDFEMLKYMRSFVIKNFEKLIKTKEVAKMIDEKYLEQCQTAGMLKNNYPKKPEKRANVEAMKDYLLLRYDDYRICMLLKEKMICKKEFINFFDIDNYKQIDKELEKRIIKKEKNDADVICFLILKYAYYLRNKFFHAEKWPAEFLMINKESHELLRMSDILESLIFDIIKNEFLLKK